MTPEKAVKGRLNNFFKRRCERFSYTYKVVVPGRHENGRVIKRHEICTWAKK